MRWHGSASGARIWLRRRRKATSNRFLICCGSRGGSFFIGESSFPLQLRRSFGLHARSGSQLIRAAQGDLVAGRQFAEDFYHVSSLFD